MPPETFLTLDSARARRLMLVQAIDESDSQGRLVGEAERDQIERQALQAVAGPEVSRPPDPGRYLDERARRVLETVDKRDARIASLERAEPWQRWLGWGLPALALVAGLLVERIDNPGQVNMLSPPLLAFVLWNLVIYLGLLLRPLWARRGRGSAGPGGLAAALRDWMGHRSPPRGSRQLRAAVATRFRLNWWRVAGALEGWRIAGILHVSAAAWGLGVGLSIVLGGLVREYRVGWESTLLDLAQVHTLLQVLFAPVVALLPLEGFSIDQVQRMHFRSGAAVGTAEARHWISLYLGLLGIVVVVPRVLLAAWCATRRRWAGRGLRIDLRERYFAELMARVSPARLVLAWAAAPGSQRALMRRLWRDAGQPEDAVGFGPRPLQTSRGDELVVWEATPQAVPPAAPAPAPVPAAGAEGSSPGRWLTRLRAWWEPPPLAVADASQADADLWLLALESPRQLSAFLPQLHALPRPVVVLHGADETQVQDLRHAVEAARLQPVEWLPLRDVAGCWAWEEPLRDAIARHLPAHKSAGGQRLLVAWTIHHDDRLALAMRLLAAPLLQAAREVQEVGSGRLSLRRLVDGIEREAEQQARQQAMATLLSRLAPVQQDSWVQLHRLHGLDVPSGPVDTTLASTRFVVRQGVNASQAGMAGAASGAAAGVGIDLITGGLTLGAGAALGAMVGGGAALVAAALKNRSAPGGATQVQLSEDMLQALCELALMQYLAVAMREPLETSEPPAAWRSAVVAVVETRRSELRALWERARATPPGDPEVAGAATERLQEMARVLLAQLND
nr:DUF3482 domain-containing protein [Ramlibacter aurantiacus]